MLLYSFCFLTTRVGFCWIFFFSSRRRHTRWTGDWSSDVCSSDLIRSAVTHDQNFFVNCNPTVGLRNRKLHLSRPERQMWTAHGLRLRNCPTAVQTHRCQLGNAVVRAERVSMGLLIPGSELYLNCT